MSIKEEIEETKKKLEELSVEEPEEIKQEETVVEEKEAEETEKKEDTPAVTEPPKEEEKPKDADDSVKEEKIRATEFYRIRRERDALQKKLEKLESSQIEKEEPKEEADNGQAEIDELLTEHRYNRAAQEFMAIEQDFAKDKQDYKDIAEGYKVAVYQSLRVLNPSTSPAELAKQTSREILRRAGNYYNKGLNPVEELYNEAIALGIKPMPKQEQPEAPEKKVTVNHDKLAENKSRNAGTAGAKGDGGSGELTLDIAASYTPVEWAKLPKETRLRLLSGG